MKRYTITAEKLEDTQIYDTDSTIKADNFIRNGLYHGYAVTVIDRIGHEGDGSDNVWPDATIVRNAKG